MLSRLILRIPHKLVGRIGLLFPVTWGWGMEVERRTFGERRIGRKWKSEGCRDLIDVGLGSGPRHSPALIISS
jgi:hypothetical protein